MYKFNIGFLIFCICLMIVFLLRYFLRTKLDRKASISKNVIVDTLYESEIVEDDFSIDKNYENILIEVDDLSVVIDQILIRSNGIFLVVQKNRSGRIVGSDKEEQWKQYKTSTDNGGLTEKSLKNPIYLTRLHIFALAQKLIELDCSAWIQGIVVFTHPKVHLEIDTKEIPVLYPHELEGYVLSYSPKQYMSLRTIKRIHSWLQMQHPHVEVYR